MAQRSPGRTTPTAGRALKLLASFAAVSVGAGVLAAGIALPAVAVAAKSTTSTVDAFNSLPADLSEQPLSQQSKILYADGSVMATFYYENRTEVSLDQVAPIMQKAIVAIEDSRFWQHGGVDPRGMARAFVNNAAGDDVQGASTLTQQWIKNVQVEKAVSALPSDATIAQRQAAFSQATESTGIAGYTRKLREIKLAIAAEKKLTKRQILDNYLNITSFGDGQYGVEAASQHYFNRPAKDLDLPDAALLAGVVQNPIYLDPVSHADRAFARRNVVLDRMLQLKVITQAEHDQAVAVPLPQQLQVQPIRNGCEQAGDAAFFCDYVYRSLLNDARMGKDRDERRQKLFRGGLVITTTLDRGRQDQADASVKARIPADTPDVGAALTTVEPGTGKVLAMAENRNYTTSSNPPPGTTAYNYNVDKGLGGGNGFQTGSTYKAFTLATWLANGHTLNESITAPHDPVYNQARDFHATCASFRGAGPYAAHNSEGDEAGTMSVLSATLNSVNTAFLEMARQLDLCQIRDTAAALGVHSTNGSPLSVQPSSVLGANYIAPLTMAAAYAAFADGGTYCTPYPVQSVVDADGNAVLTAAPACSVKLDPGIANTVTSALTGVLTKGTAEGNGIAWPAAGKTGTTNFDNADTWFIGYTRQLSTAVYVGTPNIDSKPFSQLPVKGVRKTKVYGATFAAPIWHDFMSQAMAGLPQEGFGAPSGGMVGAAPKPSATATSKPRPTSRPTSSRPAGTPSSAPTPTAPSTKDGGSPPKSTDVETLGNQVSSSSKGGGGKSSSPSPTKKHGGSSSSGGGHH